MKALVVWAETPVRRATHCFACVATGGQWVRIDGDRGRIALSIAAPSAYDLARFWRGCGLTVVEVEVRPVSLRAPLMPATCVSLVKHVLGVRSPFVLTGRQLYRYLEKRHGVSEQSIQSTET